MDTPLVCRRSSNRWRLRQKANSFFKPRKYLSGVKLPDLVDGCISPAKMVSLFSPTCKAL